MKIKKSSPFEKGGPRGILRTDLSTDLHTYYFIVAAQKAGYKIVRIPAHKMLPPMVPAKIRRTTNGEIKLDGQTVYDTRLLYYHGQSLTVYQIADGGAMEIWKDGRYLFTTLLKHSEASHAAA